MRAFLLPVATLALVLLACGGGSSSSSSLGDPPPNAPPGDPLPGPDPRDADRSASKIFANLDFESVDGTGAPAGWTCTCAGQKAACRTDDKAAHGSHALVLGSGCTAYATAKSFDKAAAVRFDGFAFGSHQYAGDIQIMADYGGESSHLSAEIADGAAFAKIAGEGPLRTAGAKQLLLVILNSNGALDGTSSGGDLHVDDLIAIQDAPNPEPQVGALLLGRHVDQLALTAGADEVTLYTPLPIDWASQVPIYTELVVDPPSAASKIEYVADAEHDWGAVVHFAPGASAASLRLSWQSVVLSRNTPAEEHAAVFAKSGDPAQWTQPSAIAESDYAPLASTAKALIADTASPEDKMLAVIGWTSSNLGGEGQLVGLDAKTVFDTRTTSCTGFANTAMAMGRVLGVPARHVTNILVGESQDMHSIDEFWLGDALGWRRVEPQSSSPFLRDETNLVMRLVLPAEEVGAAGGFSGIPKNEFTTFGGATARIGASWSAAPAFTDCSSCGNRADRLAPLHGSSADLASIFATARAAWQADAAAYVAGTLSAERMAARKKALDARTIDDVRALVSGL